MNKKIVLIIISAILLLLFGGLLLSRSNKTGTRGPISTITPVPYIPPVTQPPPTSTEPNLSIIDALPADKSTDNPPDQTIYVTFNKNVPSDIVFSLSPDVPHTTNGSNNVFSVSFSTALATKSVYVYTISSKQYNFSQSFTFTTADPTSGQDNVSQDIINASRQNQPDLYLYNQVPYTTATFAVSGSFQSTPQNHFAFIVTLERTNTDKSKQDFINWVKSLGLTDQQIQTLDISYQ